MFRCLSFRCGALWWVAAVFSAPAVSAPGGEVIGELTAKIDGQPYQGHALHLPAEGTATATYQQFGENVLVSVHALDPKSERLLTNSLQVEFSGTGEIRGSVPATVSWWPQGMRGVFYIGGSEGGQAAVQIEELQLGQNPRAAGSFSASICRKESFFAEVDLSKCLPVEGRFDSALKLG